MQRHRVRRLRTLALRRQSDSAERGFALKPQPRLHCVMQEDDEYEVRAQIGY